MRLKLNKWLTLNYVAYITYCELALYLFYFKNLKRCQMIDLFCGLPTLDFFKASSDSFLQFFLQITSIYYSLSNLFIGFSTLSLIKA